jgi:hypothetical protein
MPRKMSRLKISFVFLNKRYLTDDISKYKRWIYDNYSQGNAK